MREVIKFGKIVTFENLNPHNFHLKNDYINNLLFVGLSILPGLEALGYSPSVEQCFVSAKYMEASPELMNGRYSDKYSSGLAIRLSLADYDHYALVTDMPSLLSKVASKVYCYLHKNTKLLEFFFEMNDESKVIEVIGEEERRIA